MESSRVPSKASTQGKRLSLASNNRWSSKSTSTGKTYSDSSFSSLKGPHNNKKYKYAHRSRMQEQELLAQAVKSRNTMDKESRQQVCWTLSAAGLVVLSFTIIAVTFLWSTFETNEAMDEAGVDIQRRIAEGALTEVARTMRPAHGSVLQLAEEARFGVASGNTIWPPTRHSLMEHREQVLAKLWIQMQHDLHLRRVSSDGHDRQHVPFFGMQVLLAYQDDFQTPATSIEECVHVVQTGIYVRSKIEDGEVKVLEQGGKTVFQTYIDSDENGTETLHRRMNVFDTDTYLLSFAGPWRFAPKKCGDDMLNLWTSSPMQGAFSNFTWFGPELDRFKQLFGSVPVLTSDGKPMGLISAAVSAYYSVSPVLLRTIQDNGDLTTGGELALVAESGVLVGDSEFVSDISAVDGHEGYNYIYEVPENSTLGRASKIIRSRSGGSFCTSEHTIFEEEDNLIDVMPFHPEEYGLGPLTERWCVILSLPRKNVYQAIDNAQQIRIWSICGNAGMFTCAILLLIVSLYLALTSDRGLRRDKLSADLRQVLSSVREVQSMSSPMVLISATTFLQLTRLQFYESMRDCGLVTVLDSIDDVTRFKNNNMILFLSHQWLSFTFPDAEEGIQLCAMKAAIQTVLSDPTRTKDVYIWCDFTSIAQRHTRMQQAAIASLPVYASMADKFIIVAPPATHKDLQNECNLQSYNERGWCRAEMLAKACGSGIEEMYSCTDTLGTLMPITVEDLSRLSLNIFEGRFSYPEDVEDLVGPALGLYSLVLAERHLPHMQVIHAHIQEDKDKFFPKTYYNRKLRQRVELFGNLVALLEKCIAERESFSASRSGGSSQCDSGTESRGTKTQWA